MTTCNNNTITFKRVWVDNMMAHGAVIFWELDCCEFSSKDIKFTIEFARAMNGEYEDTDIAQVSNTYYVHDDKQRLFSKNLDLWYRVKAHKGGNTYTSEPARADGGMPKRDWLIAKEIMRKELLHMVKGPSGIKGCLLKRREYGERCLHCTDYDTAEVSKSDCPYCFGTGILGGYYPATEFWILPSPTNKSARMADSGHSEDITVQARCIAYPPVEPGDIWVSNENGRRYIIGTGGKSIAVATSVRNKPLVLNITMGLVPASHIVYDIPLDGCFLEGSYSKPEAVICEDGEYNDIQPKPFDGFDFQIPEY